MELDTLLDILESSVRETLKTKPDVDQKADPSLEDIPGQGSGRWLKIPELVAVVFDLKSSTQLGTGRHDTSTARVYKTAVESAVQILNEFDAQFIDIQGDGGFGLFWGELSYERALCAGVTIRTFSDELVRQYEAKFTTGEFPDTGFKVGIACGRVLVKHLGTPRNDDEQEPVWAGRPVNFAAKAAQAADRNEVIITGSVWDHFEKNDYVAFSCGCGGAPSDGLWEDFTIAKVDGSEGFGRRLEAGWCDKCGPSYCEAIRTGAKKRDDIPDSVRKALAMTAMREAVAKKAQADRAHRRNLNALRSKLH
ncbi:hypothetical protein [Isoptericola sp. NPDC057391]|uniref:hypothetical protein n=1 Tax=Isoptericola sp. NPDC057391 TaxID=3346117 RepID=UPI003631F8C5